MSINYNHPLASSIYSLLQFGSPEFASYLHNTGYRASGRTYKLFCFSLAFDNFQFDNGLVRLKSPYCMLTVSSPLKDNFFRVFLKGTFEHEKLLIASPHHNISFAIEKADLLPPIDIHSEMNLRFASPMVLSTGRDTPSGDIEQYYLRPDDIEEINSVLSENLRNKYEALHGVKKEHGSVELTWDAEFLSRKAKVTKKIRLDEYSNTPIDVIGILAPFSIKGDRELIKIGYEAGFGEKNSMGFGLAELDYR